MKAKQAQEMLLYQLEERLLQPDVRQSAAAVADLLADDFIEFGSSGRIFNKQQIIESLQNEDSNAPIARSITDFKTLVLAENVILVTYRIVQHNSSSGKSKNSLRSSIWTLVDGSWKIVFHQGTLTMS